jgi:hypothetical protein
MIVITPTPGRIVWFYPDEAFPGAWEKGEPLAAIVSCVHSNRVVNLAVFDSNGNSHSCISVTLVQPDDAKMTDYYCEWMPYQIGQAEKHTAQYTSPLSDGVVGD